MSTSTVSYAGQTYTFKGRPMSHATITTVVDGKPLVEFAGSLAKAQRVAGARDNRVATVKAGLPLRGLYDTDWHRRVITTVIVPTTVL